MFNSVIKNLTLTAAVFFFGVAAGTANTFAQEAAPQSPAEVATPDDGFEDLLAGGDLSKFRGYKKEEIGAGWSVTDGELIFSGKNGGDIITKETYDNFELQLDWAISEGGNSGIMFNVGLGDGAPYLTGPEIQILDDSKHGDGKSGLTSAGAIYALYPPVDKTLKPVGEWNEARIVVQGKTVSSYLNGTKVAECEMGSDDWKERLAKSKFSKWEKFASLDSGHIALQDHGNQVRFRNIRIKRLDGKE